MSRIAAIILAAGRGTRFGAPASTSKVLAEFEGRPLIQHVAEAALASAARPIMAVTGQASAQVEALLQPMAIACRHNADYAAGMAGSLKLGIAALAPELEGVVILLADMPRVSGALIDRLIARYETAEADVDAVVPACAGRWGNPVLLSRRLFPAIAALRGDDGARGLLRQADRRVLVCDVEDEAIFFDVDTPAALL